MGSFERKDLRICMLRCTDLINILRAYPDLYPIQDGANHVLSTLFRVVVRTVPSDAEIHTLSVYDQEILVKALKTCSSLLAEVSKVLTAYAPIDALCLDEKTKSVILNEVVCRYALQEDLKKLALALFAPHISMNQRKGSWTVMLHKVQAHRDTILRQMGIIREIIEIYFPASDFRQSLDSTHSAAQKKKTEQGTVRMETNNCTLDNFQALGEAGEDSVEPPSSNDTICKTKVDNVFHETERNVLLRAALRDCAPDNGAHISLDKDADDALREAAISRIAVSSSFVRPCARPIAHQEIIEASSTKLDSAIEPLNALDTKYPKKVDAIRSKIDKSVLGNITGQKTNVAKDPSEATKPPFDVLQQIFKYYRSATVKDDLKDLAEPKTSDFEAHNFDSLSSQILPVSHNPILKGGLSESESGGSREEPSDTTCSLSAPVSLEDPLVIASPSLCSPEQSKPDNFSSQSLLKTCLSFPLRRPDDKVALATVCSHLQSVSSSNAENTASLILEAALPVNRKVSSRSNTPTEHRS
ncbi:hypothetical protein N0V82_002175 [Gnomoniopsis sp. IMI 355080]|nr:hypothetical protein N0V82_002175 [Gnomoniopsis sp. IMI 355080]